MAVSVMFLREAGCCLEIGSRLTAYHVMKASWTSLGFGWQL